MCMSVLERVYLCECMPIRREYFYAYICRVAIFFKGFVCKSVRRTNGWFEAKMYLSTDVTKGIDWSQNYLLQNVEGPIERWSVVAENTSQLGKTTRIRETVETNEINETIEIREIERQRKKERKKLILLCIIEEFSDLLLTGIVYDERFVLELNGLIEATHFGRLDGDAVDVVVSLEKAAYLKCKLG